MRFVLVLGGANGLNALALDEKRHPSCENPDCFHCDSSVLFLKALLIHTLKHPITTPKKACYATLFGGSFFTTGDKCFNFTLRELDDPEEMFGAQK